MSLSPSHYADALAAARRRLDAERERALAELADILKTGILRVDRYGAVVVSRRQWDQLALLAATRTPLQYAESFSLDALPIVIETPRQQRTRILQENLLLSPKQYDLAIIFGYPPESWDGMYLLADVDRPIRRISRNWAIAREVVLIPGTHRSARRRNGREIRRWAVRRAVL